MIQNSVYTKTLVARSELRAFQDKLKKDNPKELKMLAERIKKKWFHFPIYLWHNHDNYILDWHQRLKALDLLAAEWLTLEKDLVPVVYISAASLNEAKEIVAEANSKFSTMDQEFADLWFEWCDLDDLIIPDFDYLTDDEKEKEKKEDDVPDVTTPPIVQVGDIFVLGDHKIMCGDSTSLTDVEILMNNQRASIAFTSPPYNAGTTPTEVKMGKKSKYANDSNNKTQDDYFEFMQLWTNIANEYSDYNFVNVQMLSGNKLALIDYLSLYRNNLAEIMIWNKLTAQPAMANNVLNSQYEFILVFSEKANRAIGTKQFRGTASNVLDISKQTSNEVKDHNATFPISNVQFL